jgi:hypothetical protein
MLDVVPEVLPHFLLRRARLVDEIATDLDVRSVDDGDVGANFLDEGNETRHLRIV